MSGGARHLKMLFGRGMRRVMASLCHFLGHLWGIGSGLWIHGSIVPKSDV